MPSNKSLDKLFEIKLTVGIGGVLFLISTIFIILYHNKQEYRKTLDFSVLTLTASAGLTSVFYFARSSRLELEEKKIDRALELNSKWSDFSQIYLRGETLKLLSELEDKSATEQTSIINNAFESDKNVKQAILSILNFLEKLSIAVEQGDVMEERVFDYYRNIVIRYYSLFSPWISQLRNQRNQQGENGGRYYKSLEKLCNSWRQKN